MIRFFWKTSSLKIVRFTVLVGFALTSLTALASEKGIHSYACGDAGREGVVLDTDVQPQLPGGIVTLRESSKDDGCHDEVDQKPQFPGGNEALMDFLRSNVRYPDGAARKRIEGIVYVQFMVYEDGKIGDIQVVGPVDKELDEEAVRVCKLLPDFTPAMLKGKPVSEPFILAITFEILRYDKPLFGQ